MAGVLLLSVVMVTGDRRVPPSRCEVWPSPSQAGVTGSRRRRVSDDPEVRGTYWLTCGEGKSAACLEGGQGGRGKEGDRLMGDLLLSSASLVPVGRPLCQAYSLGQPQATLAWNQCCCCGSHFKDRPSHYAPLWGACWKWHLLCF